MASDTQNGAVPGGRGLEDVYTGQSQPLKWSLLERDEDQRTDGFTCLRGSSTAAKTPGAEMLLIGGVTTLRPRGPPRPPERPHCHHIRPHSELLKERKRLSATHSFWCTGTESVS